MLSLSCGSVGHDAHVSISYFTAVLPDFLTGVLPDYCRIFGVFISGSVGFYGCGSVGTAF